MKTSITSTTSVILLVALLLSTFTIPRAQAGPVAYGVCQAGCAALVVKCYAAAGAVFGTVTAGVGTPAVILGCNAGFGMCSAKCAAICLPAPIP